MPFDQPRDVAGQQIDFEIDLLPGFERAEGRDLGVCGMMLTPKRVPSTSLTVSETPSSATEPLGAMKRARIRRRLNVMRMDSPSGVTLTTSAMPSTWPVTMWPPSSSPTCIGRSRLTGRPTFQSPSVVLDRVSPEP